MSFFDLFRKKPAKKFRIGQEVTPKNVTPIWVKDGLKVSGPKFGEVVFVCGYTVFKNGNWYIWITGYPDGYFRESDFEPLLTNDQLEDALEELNRIIMIDY